MRFLVSMLHCGRSVNFGISGVGEILRFGATVARGEKLIDGQPWRIELCVWWDAPAKGSNTIENPERI